MNEDSLFQILLQWYADLAKAKDQYSVWDCLSKSHGVYIELKCRRTHYDSLLIEKSKYDRLASAARARDMAPVYICSTPVGAWGFDLLKIQIAWEDKIMPVTTDFEDQQKIIKTVGFLDTRSGYRFY
jgi:hypothetical protein